MDAAIIDFSKAFDTVQHKRILGKLELYGESGNVHHWIKSFLESRTQIVEVDGIHFREEKLVF